MAGRRPGMRRGFTLLELLIVMVLLTLAAAAAVPAFVNFYRASRLRAGAQMLVAACTEGRERAVLRGQPLRLELSPGEDRFSLTERTRILMGTREIDAADVDAGQAFFLEMERQTRTPEPGVQSVSVEWDFRPVPTRFGREQALPETVHLLEARSLEEGEPVERITYYPNGEADGALLVLQQDAGAQLGVEVDAATAGVRVLSQQELEDRLQ